MCTSYPSHTASCAHEHTCVCCLLLAQSARKSALQVISEYESTPGAAEALEVPDLSALRQLYSEKNPAVPTFR